MQLTLNFDAGLTESFASAREVMATTVHQQGRLHKHIAADMDLSPSLLSRKLSPSPNDTARLTVDDLEAYLQTTADRKPLYYLVEKYLMNDSQRIRELEEQLANLKSRAA